MKRLYLSLLFIIFPTVCFASWFFNPFTGKMDYYVGGSSSENATFGNVTLSGDIELQNFTANGWGYIYGKSFLGGTYLNGTINFIGLSNFIGGNLGELQLSADDEYGNIIALNSLGDIKNVASLEINKYLYLENSTIVGNDVNGISFDNNNDGVKDTIFYPNGTLSSNSLSFSNTLYTPSGTIGLGVSVPVAKLDIKSSGSDTGFTLKTKNLANDDKVVILDNGNVGIGITNPIANLDIRTAASGTGFALRISDSSPSDRLVVLQSGNVGIGTTNPISKLDVNGVGRMRSGVYLSGDASSAPWLYAFSGLTYSSPSSTGTNTGMWSYSGYSGTASQHGIAFTGMDIGMTAGYYNNFYFIRNFKPTSGTATFGTFVLVPTINQTGGANGITRGVYIDPTLTSAFDWRSLEITNNVGFGLYINGTANNYINGNVGIGTTVPLGLLTVGNNANTNNLVIESDGTVQLNGTATAWDDLRVPLETTKINAATSRPDYDTFKDLTKAHLFDDTDTETVTFSAQMPHNWANGTDIEPHIHWAAIGAGVSNTVWQLQVTKAKDGTVFGGTTNTTSVSTATGAYNHTRANFPSITMSGDTISTMLMCALSRIGGNASDTQVGDAAALEIDFHYQVDSFGSRTNTTK